jgi:flavodoxin
MNIGIIVYSHSGHTLSAARRLQETLSSAGWQADLVRLETVNHDRKSADLKSVPSLAGCGTLVLCTPVHGGLPAPAMQRFLEQIPTLKGKRVACLVTHFFPRNWGADHAIAWLKAACEAKGAHVLGAAEVRWFFLPAPGRLKQAADELCRLL